MEIKKFLGMKNVTSAERLKPGHLELADNVDLDDTGKLLTRLGTERQQAGSFHSLWADGDVALVVKDGQDLHRVNTDYTTTLLTRLSAARRVSYARLQRLVLMSNGVDTLRLDNGTPGPWGTPPPVGQPVAAPGVGALPPGMYQYALTFARGDGQESGTGVAGQIELAAAGGIDFSQIESSTDPDVRAKMVYLSGPNSAEMFRALVLPPDAASASYRGDGTDLTVRLETQFASPAPAGSIVEIYSGCAFVAAGDTVFYSDPYALERFRLRNQFLRFPGAVTMFAAVNDGVYASTAESTWFLSGKHPAGFASSEVLDYGAIPGTAAKATVGQVTESKDGSEGAPGGKAVFWTTPKGVVVGMDGGQVLNMTERDVSFPGAPRGAGLVRQARGYTQYLASLEGPGVANNAYN